MQLVVVLRLLCNDLVITAVDYKGLADFLTMFVSGLGVHGFGVLQLTVIDDPYRRKRQSFTSHNIVHNSCSLH